MRFTACVFIFLCLNLNCTRQFKADDNTLHIALQGKVRSLDPLLSGDLYSHQAVAQAYEGLMAFHYLKRPLQLEPLLAESWPAISQDGLTYTFKIKKSVFFHDNKAFPRGQGRELVASDFIYSWKRIADPKNKSENYWLFENHIVGLDEWRDKMSKGQTTYDEPIEGLQAPDKHTLIIRLKTPYFQLLYALALGVTSVVPHEVVEYYKDQFGNIAVGTGPFILDQWIRGSQLSFSKNKNYQHSVYPQQGTLSDQENGLLQDAQSPLPFLDRLVMYEISEDQPRWLMFLKGDLDYVSTPKDFIKKVLVDHQMASEFSHKKMLIDQPLSGDIVYISFNTEDPFLKNKLVRQAMTLAYDRAQAKQQFYGNIGTLAHGPIPPEFEGYRVADSPFEFNLAKAKLLLAQAGYPGGQGLPVMNYEMASTNSTERQMAEFFKMQMEKIGIQIHIQNNTWPQFTEKVKKKQASIFMLAWNADYPDAENFFQLFYSPNRSPGTNNSNFLSKDFDMLYEKSKKLPPGNERTLVYTQMEKLLEEEAPWIFLIHRAQVWVRHPWVKNFKYEKSIKNNFKFLKINSLQRAEMQKKF